jgi:hypothetical protein
MPSIRTVIAALAAGSALALVPLAPAWAGPTQPNAVIPGCKFFLTKVVAQDLRHDGGKDFLFLNLNGTFYPSGGRGVSFVLNEEHPGSDFGVPSGGIPFDSTGMPVFAVTDDFPFNHRFGHGTIQCAAVHDQPYRFQDGDAKYDMTYDVTTT